MLDLNTLLAIVACLFVILIAALVLVENRMRRALKAMDELDTQVAMVLIDLDCLKNMQINMFQEVKRLSMPVDRHLTDERSSIIDQLRSEFGGSTHGPPPTGGSGTAPPKSSVVRTMRGDISVPDHPPPMKPAGFEFPGRYEGDRDHG